MARDVNEAVEDATPNPPAIPRYAGLVSFMRLPVASSPVGLDVVMVGVPFDGGTSNRPGARHGPREMRNQSMLIRRINVDGTAPYEHLRVADLGDCPVNPFSLDRSLEEITAHFAMIRAAEAIPLSAGGDHLITLPILRGLVREGPVGLVHFDSHSDTGDAYFGANPYSHGSPFRRAIEEGLIDGNRTIQVGLRGSMHRHDDLAFARSAGIRLITMDDILTTGLDSVVAGIHTVAKDGPVYITVDIDCLDPSCAPGTGTPETGGLLSRELQYILRRLVGLSVIGADVVEVSPPLDVANVTSLAGATMLLELLAVVARGTKALA